MERHIINKIRGYGDTALVTGATSGIGRAFAMSLAEAGMKLVLVARSEQGLADTKERLESTPCPGTILIPADLSKPDSADRVADTVTRAGWDIDVLINNAGGGRYCRFDELPGRNVSETLLLNSYTPTMLTHRLLPGMLERRRGAIVTVSGLLGDFAAPFFSAYSASKACIQTLAEALYGELSGTGVDILGLSPGATATNFMKANGIEREFPFPSATPERVVDTAWKALGKKPAVVDGTLNSAMVFMLRFMPRSLVSSMNRIMLKPNR